MLKISTHWRYDMVCRFFNAMFYFSDWVKQVLTMVHPSLIPYLLLLSLPPLESGHHYSKNRRYQVVSEGHRHHQAEPEARVHRYHQAEDCPPKLTKSCTTSSVPSTEWVPLSMVPLSKLHQNVKTIRKVKTVKCQPGPPKKVCKEEPQPDPGCLDVPQPPDQGCLDRVEEICEVGFSLQKQICIL